MKCLRKLVLSHVVLTGAVAAATRKPCDPFNWDKIDNVISFGDSYTFIQGELGYPSYSWIGDFRQGHLEFSPEELLSNHIIQNFNGTSAAGPNWIEFLTGCAVENGRWLPRDCDVHLWNFAFAGADYSEEFLPLHHDFTTPMVNQTQQYLTYAHPVIGKDMDKSKALVAIWIGINDVSDAANLEDVDLSEFFDQIISSMFSESVQWMYDADFRNFLFLNVPPRDRSPSTLSNGKQEQVKQQTEWWNQSLREQTARFARSHRDANAILYDTNRFLNKVLDNPSQYGFLNTTGTCLGAADERVLEDPAMFGCTPLDTYFWLNSGHITSHTHKVLADDLRAYLREQ